MFFVDFEEQVKKNDNFRKVLHTGDKLQIVAMNILKGEEIGQEVHAYTDQVIMVIEGKCEALLRNETMRVEDSGLVFVPASTVHNFKNIGDGDLKILTIYSPPQHPDGTIHKTKADAQNSKKGEKGGAIGSFMEFDEP